MSETEKNMELTGLTDDDESKILDSLFRKAGITGMNQDEKREFAAKQEKSVVMAKELIRLVNELHEAVDVAEDTADLKDQLDVFYEIELPEFMERYGIDGTSSNVIKMLIGVHNDFKYQFPIKGHNVSGYEKLKHVYVNFTAALREVILRCDWEVAEESVPLILDVTGVTNDDMAEMNYSLICGESRGKITRLLDNITEGYSEVADEKLDAFAAGEIGLEDIQRETRVWKEVLQKVRLFLSEDPDAN